MTLATNTSDPRESQLIAAITGIVRQFPGSTAKQIRARLANDGVDVDKSTINSKLHRNPGLFAHDQSQPPRWLLNDSARQSTDERHPFDLYAWQWEALHAWRLNGYRGVIEAVTGAGKTRVGLAAADEVLEAGGKVAIVVPTKELMKQWRREAEAAFARAGRKERTIGFMGDGERASLQSYDLLIATPHSGSRYFFDAPQLSLMIADECHHYGAETWSLVLEEEFGRRLGLTATYSRPDSGIEQYLAPYFGAKPCFTIGYERALAENVIAPFKIAFVGVSFSDAERVTYAAADKKAAGYRMDLIRKWNVRATPFSEFMKDVTALKNSKTPEGSRLAGFYLTAFNKRREVLASAAGKLTRLRDLAPAVDKASKTIIFAQTIAASTKVVETLRAAGLAGGQVTSDMDMDERRAVLEDFEAGDFQFVSNPQLLTEGIDVASADLGIVFATSRSKRQLIQRLGRIVRKKQDRRVARFVVLFVEGTAEDPTSDGAEDFVEEITTHATQVRTFSSHAPTRDVLAYLNDWS